MNEGSYPHRSNGITRVLIRGGRRVRIKGGDVRVEAELRVVGKGKEDREA